MDGDAEVENGKKRERLEIVSSRRRLKCRVKGGFYLRWGGWTILARGFLDCEDVPDITDVAKAASVRWDPINRVIVSTERERRFLYGEERRRRGRLIDTRFRST